jgi:hypothetical protein
MHLKNPTQIKLRFFLIDPTTGSEISISGNTLKDITDNVVRQISQFDAATNGSYSKKAALEAKRLKLDLRFFWQRLIEHQICLRSPNPDQICYNDGIGDKLSEFSRNVDSAISSMPTPIRKMAEGIVKLATLAATGKKVKKLGGCSSCSGTKTFSPDTNRSLGRAGVLNNRA